MSEGKLKKRIKRLHKRGIKGNLYTYWPVYVSQNENLKKGIKVMAVSEPMGDKRKINLMVVTVIKYEDRDLQLLGKATEFNVFLGDLAK